MKHLKLESLGEVEQSLVQIFNAGSHPAVTVCLGTGVESRQSAARSDRIFHFYDALTAQLLKVCLDLHQDHG